MAKHVKLLSDIPSELSWQVNDQKEANKNIKIHSLRNQQMHIE